METLNSNAINGLESFIMIHLGIFDSINQINQTILAYSAKEELDQIIFQLDNRARLLSILSKVQGEIENIILNIKNEELTKDKIDIIKTWQMESNTLIYHADAQDRSIIEKLDIEKQNTTQEIAGLYKKKEQFKGYNLNNTKK